MHLRGTTWVGDEDGDEQGGRLGREDSSSRGEGERDDGDGLV